LKKPETNHKTAGFTDQERACFTSIISDGFVDSFRFLYPNRKDAYTFWSYMRNSRAANIGWRIDYFVMSPKLLPYLSDQVIRDKVLGSDHAPLTLFLQF
jgi:exodeoxyribonuclease III